MPKGKRKTVITLPVGKVVVNAVAYSVFILVAALWAFAGPDDNIELVIQIVGCIIGIWMASILLSSKAVEYEKLRPGFKSVAPGLWQGGIGDELFSFEKYDFDIAVDLRADSERPPLEVAVPTGKQHFRCPMDDRILKNPEEIRSLAVFLAQRVATKKIGVFCSMGLNRSGLVCAETARLIASESTSGEEETISRMFNTSFLSHLGKSDD